MTLKDFIKNTVYDINIALEETYKETGKYYQIGESHAKDKPIAFDIAVTQVTHLHPAWPGITTEIPLKT